MQASQIEIVPFGPEHLEAAVALSRQAGWPHRTEDWQLALALSEGMVAVEDGKVVGTVLVTPYKEIVRPSTWSSSTRRCAAAASAAN